jgi:hypothetical protein
MSPYTLFADVLAYYAALAAEHDVAASDLQSWLEAASNPGSLLEDPDCCHREFFVVTVGKVVV